MLYTQQQVEVIFFLKKCKYFVNVELKDIKSQCFMQWTKSYLMAYFVFHYKKPWKILFRRIFSQKMSYFCRIFWHVLLLDGLHYATFSVSQIMK